MLLSTFNLLNNPKLEEKIMKSIICIVFAMIFLSVITAYTVENPTVTIMTNDGSNYTVTIKNFQEINTQLRVGGKMIPFDQINSIKPVEAVKTFIKSDGTEYTEQRVQVILTNDKKYSFTVKNFDKWLRESTNPEWDKKDQIISRILLNKSKDEVVKK